MQTVDFKGREAHDVREMFGNLPLVEAKHSMVVYVSKPDIDQAVPRDPNNCVFAQACKRAFGSQAVLFYPTVAYVDMLDEDGKRIVMRFRVTEKTRAAIERFDLTQSAAEATFVLQPVPPTMTLAAKTVQQRKRRKAYEAGVEKHPTRIEGGKKAYATRRNKELMGLRVGSND